MARNDSAAARQQRKTKLRDRIESEGAEAGYAALMAVCHDPNAPAQARATAGTTLFRAAGLLEKRTDDAELEPHEMSYAQLQAVVIQGLADVSDDEEDAEDQEAEAVTLGHSILD